MNTEFSISLMCLDYLRIKEQIEVLNKRARYYHIALERSLTFGGIYESCYRRQGSKSCGYPVSGLFAGIAGIVMPSRTNSIQPLAGKGFEFDVLTAAVLGGVSVNGGYGKISNVVAGVFIIGVLSNGMVLLNISQYVQMVTKGLVLFVAVAFDCMQKSGKFSLKFLQASTKLG